MSRPSSRVKRWQSVLLLTLCALGSLGAKPVSKPTAQKSTKTQAKDAPAKTPAKSTPRAKHAGAAKPAERPGSPAPKRAQATGGGAAAKKKPSFGNKFLEIPAPEIVREASASVYASMTNDEVRAELARRKVPYQPAVPPPPGVRFPIRLTAPLQGVLIRSTLPPSEWDTTVFNVLDGRLALALDDFCRILARHDIVELVHFTMYRPAPAQALPGEEATRHPAGLAIDVGALKKKSGHWLAVGPNWSSHIGAKTCGADARGLFDPGGRELRSIVCEAADQRVFHFILSPHFDAAHADHLHLEIKPDVKWFLTN